MEEEVKYIIALLLMMILLDISHITHMNTDEKVWVIFADISGEESIYISKLFKTKKVCLSELANINNNNSIPESYCKEIPLKE